LNFFVPEGFSGAMDNLPPLAIVDMPGYGYAKAPIEMVERWTELVFEYMRGRVTLKRIFLLIDARHGVKQNDLDAMKLMDKAAMSYQLVLTKTDKIKAPAIPRMIDETLDKIKKSPAAYPEVIATSSEKSRGLDDLREAIAKAINP
jgi:GTP-binding protein